MATFQSQINILAAANCGVHKRIKELEDNQIRVKYNEESTEFYMGNKTEQIKYLGYKAYDAILLFKEGNYYLMGYNGKCEKIEDNSEDIYMYIYFKNSDLNEILNATLSIITTNSDRTATILINDYNELSILSQNDIIRYQLQDGSNKYGFIILTNDGDININNKLTVVNDDDSKGYISLTGYCKRYESNTNYENIKFIDLRERISNDGEWTLPPQPN